MSIVEINPRPRQDAVSGIVTGRAGNVYLVTTASGRVVRAEAADTWIVGAPVTVIGGQIVSSAGRQPPTRIYEV